MVRHKYILAFAIIFILAGSVAAIYYLTSRYEIPSTVHVYTLNIEAFWDEACTQPCESIDWGWLYPGESKNQTIYIRKEGNVNVTLWLYTADWSPENGSDYINVTWNRENYLMTEQVIDATITLTVSNQTNIESFNFTIIIKAVEAPSPPPPPGDG